MKEKLVVTDEMVRAAEYAHRDCLCNQDGTWNEAFQAALQAVLDIVNASASTNIPSASSRKSRKEATKEVT